MAKQNLATVTNDLIESYGNTAKNVITACNLGNKRAVSYMDQSWANAVRKAGTRLTADVRGNAIATQKKITALYAKGVESTTDSANVAVNKVVELAGKGVDQVAANAGRFEKSTGVKALSTLAVASLPAAQAAAKAAAKLEVQSSELAKKIGGRPAKAKAAAVKVKAVAVKAKAAVAKRAPAKKVAAVVEAVAA